MVITFLITEFHSVKTLVASLPEKRGYIVASKYSEQQMGATMNLLTLCKWTKHVGALSVEPLISESIFRIPPKVTQSRLSSALHIRGYFNITCWNNITTKYGAAQ